MTGKKLIIMAITLIVLITVAVVQKKKTDLHKSIKTKDDITLLAGTDLNTITGIEVSQGSNSVAIIRKDGKWQLPALSDYPADFTKLANIIQRTSEIKLGEPITAGNIDLSEFGLNKNSKQITLKSDGKDILTINIGGGRNASKTAGWSNQHFIKKNGDDAIYLVDDDFRAFSDDAKSWIKTEILNITPNDIVAVNIGDIKMKLVGTDWQLEGLKDNEELLSSETGKLRSALQYLNCVTIADTKSDKDLGFDSPSTYTAETKDGIVYTATIGNATDNGRYARFAVQYNKPKTPNRPDKDAPDDKKAAYEKALEQYKETVATNEEKVQKLNNKLSNWTYILNNYKAETFIMTRDKLVKTKEPPKEKKADTTKHQD